jgi:hypothetical protein
MRDPAKAVQVIDLMVEFFEDGTKWCRGWHDPRTGARCILGALDHLERLHRMHDAGTRAYIDKALPDYWKRITVTGFNDKNKDGWLGVLRLLKQARKLAASDPNKPQKPQVVPRKPTRSRNDYRLHWEKRQEALANRIELLTQIYEDRRSPRVRWITFDTYILCPMAPEPVELPLAA